MTSHPQIDFNDLTILLAAELNAGIKYIDTDANKRARLRIDSIKVSLGQEQPCCEENAPEEIIADHGFLHHKRYGFVDRSWNYELIVTSSDTLATVMRPNMPDEVIKPDLPRIALALFKNEDIQVIKGVDKHWASIFNKAGLMTVYHVYKSQLGKIYQIVEETNSLYPLTVHSKVLLLNVSIPVLPKMITNKLSLYELLELSPKQILEEFGSKYLSGTAAEQLLLFLSRIYTLIDGDVLKKTKL